MKKMTEVHWGRQFLFGTFSLVLAFLIAFTTDQFSIVSHAQSEGKVTATSANIRKSADSGSEIVGSAAKDAKVTINGQTKAADGTVWYQIFVDAETLGFIRSDLVNITDGTTPPTLAADTTTTPASTPAPAVNETPVEVTEVNPVSGTVTGGERVRVRGNASTTSEIKATAQSGMALTVIGKAIGTDGKEWYQVKFTVNGSEVTGFIRSDYVSLSEELTLPGTETGGEGDGQVQEPVPEEPEVTKDWDTQLQGTDWYLIDNLTPGQYKIQDMFDSVKNNSDLYAQAVKSNKSLKAVIIVLVILIIALAGAVTLLIFKIRDMTDSAYFAEVEKETVRRRSADRPQGQRPARPVQGGQRPQGQRPARPVQGGQTSQGQRPVRPAQGGQAPQGQRPVRPAQGGQASQGQRPVRPAQEGQTPQGQRPVRPAQEGQAPQGQRPVRPAQTEGHSAPSAPARPDTAGNGAQNPAWKTKNFMADDDEFEFEFLNWDGEEE